MDYFKGDLLNMGSREIMTFFLGRGEGGTVYRLIDLQSRNTKIRKDYYDQRSLLQDVFALRILKELTQKVEGVEVREPFQSEGRTLYFLDVKGYNLEDYPYPLKRESLIQDFKNWLEQIRQHVVLDKNFQAHVLGPDTLWILYQVPRNRKKELGSFYQIELILKPNNVIVDAETGDLIIFDPH